MVAKAERIGVVGAGILGLAIARRIQQARPDAQLVIFEKEASVAAHQTGHNSGVVHAGIYYEPGSLKALLCRRGVGLLHEFCDEKGLVYRTCGKLVIAASAHEASRLDAIEARALANGVPGLRRLRPSEILDLEPFAVGVAALYSPQTAITDFRAISEALADDVRAGGGQILLATPILRVNPIINGVQLVTEDGVSSTFDQVILCAGLHSDVLAKTAGDGPDPAIIPFRGEYLTLLPERAHMVQGLIYPVPDPEYPFLGVHFTKRVDGSVDIGPNAVLAFAREGYGRAAFSWNESLEILRYPGFWRIAKTHWRKGAAEMAASASTRLFVKRARVYVPSLAFRDVARGGTGVRAQAVDRDGTLVDDFRIHTVDRVTALRNAPSPAATSALAIAEHVVAQLSFL